MGDQADMMMDGTLCAGCGTYEDDYNTLKNGVGLCDVCFKDKATVKAHGG